MLIYSAATGTVGVSAYLGWRVYNYTKDESHNGKDALFSGALTMINIPLYFAPMFFTASVVSNLGPYVFESQNSTDLTSTIVSDAIGLFAGCVAMECIKPRWRSLARSMSVLCAKTLFPRAPHPQE